MALQNQTPTKPLILSAGSVHGGATGNGEFTISGLADPGTTIKVYDGVRMLGTVIVAETGAWSFAPAAELKSGKHQFCAISIDNLDQWSTSANPVTATSGTAAPALPVAPTTDTFLGHTGLHSSAVANGGSTTDRQPTMTGTGTPGDKITMYEGTAVIGSTVIGQNGAWSLAPASALMVGAHSVCVVETNAAGLSSAPSGFVEFTVSNMTPPAITYVDTCDAGHAIIDHNVAPGSVVAHSNILIHGQGDSGSTIKVYDGSALLGSSVVDATGNWSFATSALSDSTHDLSATQTNAPGVTSPFSNHYSVTVDTTTPNKPVVMGITDSTGHAISYGGTTADPHPSVTGMGSSGNTITLYDRSTVIGSTTVRPDGTWSIAPAADLSSGTHSLCVTEKNLAGRSSMATSYMMFVVRPLPDAPTILLAAEFDYNSTNTGLVPLGGVSPWASVQIEGTAKAGAVVQVYDGASLLGSVVAKFNGTWAFKVKEWPNGVHDISATQKDTSGLESLNSNHFGFTVAVTGPMPPSITDMTQYDTQWNQIGSKRLPSGGLVHTPYLDLSGTGKPGDLVTLYDGATAIGSTRVSVYGRWVFSAPTLADGPRDLSAVQTDGDGAVSQNSNHVIFSIDTSTSATPVILNVASLSGPIALYAMTSDPSLIVSGTGIANQTVTLYDGNTALGSAQVDAERNWSFKLASSLPGGMHDLSATLTDTTGKVGPASMHFYFWVYGGGLSAPSIDHVVSDDATSLTAVSIPPAHSAVAGTNVEISGHGEPGRTLTIYDGMTPLGAVAVGDDGRWDFTLPDAAVGTHDLSATQTLATGELSPGSNHWTFTIDPLPAPKPTMGGSTRVVVPIDDAAQASVLAEPTPATSHHTTLGEHDAFKGTTGDETVDLNANPASYFKETTAHIEGGAGIDTLHLMGDHQILDLTSLTGKTASAAVSGIEVIDLGGHANSLKLSLVDVLNLGEMDLFQTDGKQQMMVNGSNGDNVALSNTHIAGISEGEWDQHGTALVGGMMYNVYEHSGAHTELLVQQGVLTTLHT
ncbi:hemolysin-type calcium-binding region [Caballeronia udeis]|uniref:Hemolysin-type calcium-binding region n=1 Tax=Caballeronia udeis TaxID=1232866 RepID=A0A158JGG4_9BURK|nr:Ig-like domain-containing protein [Caballeronia udeis]SAL67904.1 hemolysin-type calcium-binding region [Caballeronia udeis]